MLHVTTGNVLSATLKTFLFIKTEQFVLTITVYSGSTQIL